MKKFTFLLASSILAFSSTQAQEFDNKSRSIVLKFTETWCPPCGGWGWSLAEDIITDIGDKGYYFGVMGSSDPSSMNAYGYSYLSNNWPTSGVPTFFVNNTEAGTSLSSVSSIYNAFDTTTPVASPVGKFSISGDKLFAHAKAKFWADATGEYFMSAWISENGIAAAQASQPGTPRHHYIYRASMQTNRSPWGVQIVTTSAAANEVFEQDFEYVLPASWNKDSLHVFITLFKKNGSKYELVNVIKAQPEVLSIQANNNVAFNIYPNPTNGNHITVKADNITNISIADVTGKELSTQAFAATDEAKLDIATLTKGVYMITIKTEQGTASSKFVKD